MTVVTAMKVEEIGEVNSLDQEKELLLTKLDNLINDLVNRRKVTPIQIFGPIAKYIEMCGDLQEEIVTLETFSRRDIYKYKKKINLLETRFEQNFKLNSLVLPVFIIYIGIILMVFIFTQKNVSEMINNLIGIDSSSRLATIGIVGALLYFSTEILEKIRKKELENKQLEVILNISIRLFIAVVVPLVLLVLFFKSDGTFAEVTVSPELLSFICGYSMTLVIDLMNKLVEKVSNMIRSL